MIADKPLLTGRGWTPMDADKGKCGTSSRTVGGSGIADDVGTYYTDVVKRVEEVGDKVDNPRPRDAPTLDKNGWRAPKKDM